MSTYSKTFMRVTTAAFCIGLVLALNFTPIIPGVAKPAEAQLIVLDPAVLAGVTATATATGAQTTIMQVLNGIAWVAAKVAIQSMTKSMVNWINTGFNGSPAFVTDLNQNMRELSDAVADDFFSALQQNTGINVNSPFQDQVTQALRDEYYRSSGGGYPNSGYNLNLYSDNPRAFLAGEFGANGGFNAWFATLSNDQNNPIGALRAQKSQLSASIENARANRLSELNWGRGYLSWRGKCEITKAAGSPTELGQTDTCAKYAIETPGSLIETSLGITANSPLHQLELADSVNEIIGALTSQLVGQVLGGGGLAGLSKPSSGGSTPYINQATNASQYSSASLAQGFMQTISDMSVSTRSYIAGWQRIQAVAQSCTAPAAVTALADATANIARGTNALTLLNQLSTEASAASGSLSASTAISAASTRYQSLLSDGSLISAQEVASIQTQSAATADGTTLYDTLVAACPSST